jgi:uncharacterized protein YutE (UPF0331/DUF86 family)
MANAYILAMETHLKECRVDLGRLHQIFSESQPSHFEMRAAERTLQVLIEACIGISKHWVKGARGSAPPDAYRGFEALSQEGVPVNLELWRSMIGLRNALVHDYLNVDADVIRGVILEKRYLELLEFGSQGLEALTGLTDKPDREF